VILTCPDCQTRYRFEESRIPEKGLAVRCKRCQKVFRAHRASPGAPAAGPPVHGSGAREAGASPKSGAASGGRPGTPTAVGDKPGGGKASESAPAGAPGAKAVPVTVIAPAAPVAQSDIQRLTRIIISDIVIYGPEKAERAIREGKFTELYRLEIEEGRKMVRSRFPGAATAAALAAFEASLKDLLDSRRKELMEASVAL
jgi:predicted Zn finger-like uncharacterized protein